MPDRTVEKIMNLLISALMVVFFIILAPLWAVFYGGILVKDYLALAKA